MGKRKRNSFGVAKPSAGGKKKVWGSKNVLHSPFSHAFPPALAGSADAVIDILKEEFPKPPMFRPSMPRPRRDDEKAAESGESSTSGTSGSAGDGVAVRPKQLAIMECDDQLASEAKESEQPLKAAASDSAEVEEKRAEAVEKEVTAGSLSAKRPTGMRVGMNEVTKSLEKGHVALVVAARDASPPILISHLPALCYMQDAVLVPASGNGDGIAAVLGVKKLLAFALLRPERVEEGAPRELIQGLLDALRPHATPLNFPWLAVAKGDRTVPPTLAEPILAPPNKLL